MHGESDQLSDKVLAGLQPGVHLRAIDAAMGIRPIERPQQSISAWLKLFDAARWAGGQRSDPHRHAGSCEEQAQPVPARAAGRGCCSTPASPTCTWLSHRPWSREYSWPQFTPVPVSPVPAMTLAPAAPAATPLPPRPKAARPRQIILGSLAALVVLAGLKRSPDAFGHHASAPAAAPQAAPVAAAVATGRNWLMAGSKMDVLLAAAAKVNRPAKAKSPASLMRRPSSSPGGVHQGQRQARSHGAGTIERRGPSTEP